MNQFILVGYQSICVPQKLFVHLSQKCNILYVLRFVSHCRSSALLTPADRRRGTRTL